MPDPDLKQSLSEIADHGSRVLKPQPMSDIVRRGRQRRRHRRVAGTVGLAAAVLGIAGGTYALTGPGARPVEVTPMPLIEAAAPSPDPLPGAVLTGKRAVTLKLAGGAEIVAGYDDDDRVVAEQTPGKDYDLRNRWLLRPAGNRYQLVQVTERPGGEVCAAVEAGALRIRICDAEAGAQQFAIVTASEPEAGTHATQVLMNGGTTVRRDADHGLVTKGGSASVIFEVVPA